MGAVADLAGRPDGWRCVAFVVSDWADPSSDSLALRAASSVVLIAAGLGAALAGGPWLAAAAAAAHVAMSFEWARMSTPRSYISPWAASALGGFAAILAASWGAMVWSLLALATGAVMAVSLSRAGWARRLEAGFGALYVGAPCVALLWLRGQEPFGLTLVLVLFAMIWSADIAAYFGGRFIGGPKLLPSLSPRKTWAGLVAGVIAGGAAGAVAARTLGTEWVEGFAAGAAMGLIGLGGDLFESLVKRRFGVKDASNLIPGHGGVLDRLDGLMAATLAGAVCVALAPAQVAALLGFGR